MKNNLSVKKYRALLIAGALTVFAAYFLRPGNDHASVNAAPAVEAMAAEPGGAADKDTPETVMEAGKHGVEGINNFLSVLKEAQAVSAHMARDKEHAAKVLELAQRNDRAGLAALFKRDAPNSQIEILEIKDFTYKATYKREDGTTVIVCVSNSHGCNGRNFVLLA